jgi:hypothetical protein
VGVSHAFEQPPLSEVSFLNGKVAEKDHVDVPPGFQHVLSGFAIVSGSGNPIRRCLFEFWHRQHYTSFRHTPQNLVTLNAKP